MTQRASSATRSTKRWAVLVQCLSIFVTFATSLLASEPATETIRFVSDWYPPFFAEPTSERPGYVIELLREIVAMNPGQKLDYQLMPTSRSRQFVGETQFDCVGEAVAQTDARYIYSRLTYGIDEYVYFVKAGDKWTFDGKVSSFEGRTWGVVKGYLYPEPLLSWLLNSKNKTAVQWISDERPQRANLQKLLRGRVDTLMDSKQLMMHLARTDQVADAIQIAGNFHLEAPIQIACVRERDNSGKWLQEFENGLQTFRKNGRLEIILKRYQLTDWNRDSK